MDSNIFLDLWWDRESGLEPLGVFAKQFFDAARACKYALIVSSSTLTEIELNFDRPGVVKEFFAGFEALGKLRVVTARQDLIDTAKGMRGLDGIPVHDRVHALIAKEEGVTIITRDKHFERLGTIAPSMSPEDLKL